MPVLSSPSRPVAGASAGLVRCRRQPRVAAAITFLTVMSLIAGCGNAALRGPSASRPTPVTTSPNLVKSPTAPVAGNRSTAESPNPTTSAASPEAGRKIHYTYSLPIGDTPNAQDDAVVYMYLLRGDCAFAQKYLNQTWYRLGTGGPRTVLMLQAAIEMCRGNDSAARHFVQLALTRYGRSGLAKDEYSCNIYRATGSVWQQVPQSSLNCPGGDIPLWPGNRMFPENRPCEDPRFGTGECPSTAPSTESGTLAPTPPSTRTEPSSATPTAKTTLSPDGGATRP